MSKNVNVSEIFGSNVFSDVVMKERLPKATYKELKKTIDNGEQLTLGVANVVAHAMKEWAVEKGATHYTHWFQPMTGKTAEKHDSFLSPVGNGKAVMEFSGKELIKGEPDASSFPNGGLRATFEARGYTAWDCTSPAFVKDGTLCIPTAFCSYTGEALDKKTPLLRSMEALNVQAMRILKLFGNDTSKKVVTTVGPEQEYFLVDKKLYKERKDLLLTGRTLFGAPAPKGQEMDDHYFGSIKERVSAFMKEADEEFWKMGIASKTKHNEVAPGQHEMAPIYTTTNIAADHNQLVMDILCKVAAHHDLACLLHEKPFAGVNGSGKHNNWSMSTDDGMNLLEPGKTPHENTQFLLFLAAIIAGVDEYAPILRMSAADVGNDHRLGANEAPPAVISMFLGDQLSDIVEQIKAGKLKDSKVAGALNIGVATLPDIPRDVTDRNRTSPFAFTGNRFEFRMLGSSASISGSNITLNTIVAEELKRIADEIEGASDLNTKLIEVITRLITDHERVIFNGDGYADSWIGEAEKRGLPNIKSSVESYKAFTSESSIKVFTNHKVFTEGEIFARQEIIFEEYEKTINIEALTMVDMAKKQILPAAMDYVASLADSMNTIVAAVPAANVTLQESLIVKISDLLGDASEKLVALESAVKAAASIDDIEEKAFAYREKVFVSMGELRTPCDEIEALVSEEYWPFP
ncbi:MAG: glutamine synthetase III, partial [Clostridiaceae bacterium]